MHFILLFVVVHLLLGAAILFFIPESKIREKHFDYKAPNLRDLQVDSCDIYKMEKYVDEVIIPYSKYIQKKEQIELALRNNTWLISILLWLLTSVASYYLCFKLLLDSAFLTAVLSVILTALVGIATYFLKGYFYKKSPSPKFIFDYNDCYKEFIQYNNMPTFPISEERHVYNTLYMHHASFLKSLESDIHSKNTGQNACAVIYLIMFVIVIILRCSLL